MKKKILKLVLFAFLIFIISTACKSHNLSLNAPGTVFIRQKVKDIKTFRKVFLGQKNNLKTHGFSAYSLHLDLKDSHIMIVTLKCSDLKKSVDFVRSPDFMSALDKTDTQIPMVWYGLDTTERQYTNQPKMTGGIVIARNEVRNYKFWLDCFYKEDGGKHNHPGRQYKNTNYSIHHLPGNPEVAIVAHEASDVTKAPAFMTSNAMKGEMEATGVIGLEIWYGINLEEGLF
jgi:hypothetical protein